MRRVNYFNAGVGRMHYVDEGSGDPIVFVHGNPAWSYSFRHLIQHFSKTYRCIAPDHIGFGLSDKPEDYDYSPESHAGNFAALMDQLDLNNITFVFNDWGGPIALHYAARYPDKVKSLVVMNSWCWSVKGDKHYERFSGFMGGLVGRFLIKQFNFFVNGVMKKAVYNKKTLTPDIMSEYRRVTADKTKRKAMYVLPKAIIGASAWLSALESCVNESLSQVPTLILWGVHDIAFREQELLRWESMLKNHKTKRLENAGHFPEEEVPEQVTKEMQVFFDHL